MDCEKTMLNHTGTTREGKDTGQTEAMCRYRLVVPLKYGVYDKPLITDSVAGRAKEIFQSCCLEYRAVMESWEHDERSVCVTFLIPENKDCWEFAQEYVSMSGKKIMEEFPEANRDLPDKKLWGIPLLQGIK